MAKKTCHICGRKELYWNKKHYEKTGKWQLIDHKKPSGAWCIKNQSQPISQDRVKPILCKLCDESSFGLCRSEDDYKQHIKIYHPNNEVLTELDWHMKQSPNEKPHESWSCDSHYKNYI